MEAQMEQAGQHDVVTSRRAPAGAAEPIRTGRKLYAGIDIGSTSSDVVILDESGKLLLSSYRRTMGRPLETVREQLDELIRQVNPADIVLTAATGSAGRLLAGLLELPFVNEVPAQAAAVGHLYPDSQRATVIDMGGQDSKLIFLANDNGQPGIRDFALNTVCAAGTGSFLDQQAQRLGIDIENQFGRLALESRNVPRMAGRCSVFAKSDMIHLQQQATPMCDIIAGLSLALARNLKSNLGCGREFVKPIVFTGGVAANIGVVKALEQVLELPEGKLVVPEQHFFTGAIGAVLVAKTKHTAGNNGKIDLGCIDRYLAERGSALKNAPRRDPLPMPALAPPESPVFDSLLEDATEPIDAYLGIDVGSLSTNVVVMDTQKRILAKVYLMTAGRPLDAVRSGLKTVGEKVAGKVNILGAATTGSGRYLTGDFIGADVVINEITAQAAGAAIVNPKVDTIFEIGGQDSKYISLENGVVVDFEMNHACAAGTGSFLEEQAQRLGISINNEFAQHAFNSNAPIKLGERCTVFMESDLLSYQQQGAKTEDLVAGLSYSIVANYLNRVVGRRKIGDNICFQGGTAFNKAVWAAFEKVTGKPIMVPDHHEVTGALGAAAIAADYMKEQGQSLACKFKGFDSLANVNYSVESFTCEHCPNDCEIKKVQLPDAEPLYYGSRCDRYNLKKKTQKVEDLGAFEFRRKTLLQCAGLTEKKTTPAQAKVRVGIPMALIAWQLLPLFAKFLKELGCEVVLSGKSNKRIIRRGVELVTAQTCFPVKVTFGHIEQLIEKKVDYIFLPSVVSMAPVFPENKHNKLCPYVQSIGHQAQTAFADKLSPGSPGGLGSTKIINLPIRLGDGKRLMRKSFVELAKKLGIRTSAVPAAMAKALGAQAKFDQAMKRKGKEILDNIPPDQKLFVLVSRPYNGCDDGLNLELPKKLAEHGAQLIPMDMLDLENARLGDKTLHESVFWSYGQKILRASELIAADPRLFAVYMSNFSCGPDSFLLTFFKHIMGEKPCLQLELDEHSADAGVITRLEAFLESLKRYRPESLQSPQPKKIPAAKIASATSPKLHSDTRLYIPYMSDCAYGIAACLRAHGQSSEVIPIADEAALVRGRAVTTGKECLPCAITAGDMLKLSDSPNFNPAKAAFFMPTASGPCRFGMYNCLHRLILKYAGLPNVAVVSPNQDSSFYNDLLGAINGSTTLGFTKSIWTAVVGIDLLQKVLLRIRPFAADPARAQRVYDTMLMQWIEAIENRRPLQQMRELMATITDYFDAVERSRIARKPRIGIVGEIYVRTHPFANNHIVDRLEKLGAVCDVAPLSEWIYYTNFTKTRSAKHAGQICNVLTNMLQNRFQHKIEKMLAQPLEQKFGPLAEHPVDHVIELAAPYLHHSFEGEAILSIGKIVEYHHQGFGGVINVMPFTCMPSTVVSTQTRRISADCNDMPILNLSFDGQEDPALTTRLEAFIEQVTSRTPQTKKQTTLLQPKT